MVIWCGVFSSGPNSELKKYFREHRFLSSPFVTKELKINCKQKLCLTVTVKLWNRYKSILKMLKHSSAGPNFCGNEGFTLETLYDECK